MLRKRIDVILHAKISATIHSLEVKIKRVANRTCLMNLGLEGLKVFRLIQSDCNINHLYKGGKHPCLEIMFVEDIVITYKCNLRSNTFRRCTLILYCTCYLILSSTLNLKYCFWYREHQISGWVHLKMDINIQHSVTWTGYIRCHASHKIHD